MSFSFSLGQRPGCFVISAFTRGETAECAGFDAPFRNTAMVTGQHLLWVMSASVDCVVLGRPFLAMH